MSMDFTKRNENKETEVVVSMYDLERMTDLVVHDHMELEEAFDTVVSEKTEYLQKAANEIKGHVLKTLEYVTKNKEKTLEEKFIEAASNFADAAVAFYLHDEHTKEEEIGFKRFILENLLEGKMLKKVLKEEESNEKG